MTFHYDIVELENKALALFIDKQPGVPETPNLIYNEQNKTLMFTRSPGNIQHIQLDKKEAILAFDNPEQANIVIVEVDENDPDEILSYTLRIARS